MNLLSSLYGSQLSTWTKSFASNSLPLVPQALFIETYYVWSEVVCLFRSLSLCTQNPTHIEFLLLGRLSLSHTHTYIKNCGLWTFLSVCMAGKLMHAVQYFGYGGGASGLKVIFIFVVHFCNHH